MTESPLYHFSPCERTMLVDHLKHVACIHKRKVAAFWAQGGYCLEQEHLAALLSFFAHLIAALEATSPWGNRAMGMLIEAYVHGRPLDPIIATLIAESADLNDDKNTPSLPP